MTPEQISLVRHSLRPLTAHAAEAGAFFYDRLFDLDPSLRALFPADLRQQGQKFVETLGAMINALDRAEKATAELEDLGRRHQEYGVQPHHYEVLREALLWSMAQMLGDDFDEDVAAAWCAAYNTAARAMQKAEQVPSPR